MIVDKVILAATARIAARKARESVQRKSPMGGCGMPGKLADCSDKDPANCELFLETAPESKRILELNPNHPVVEKMLALCENDATSEQLEQYTNILYGEALLTEGSPLPDPLAFVKSVSALMK